MDILDFPAAEICHLIHASSLKLESNMLSAPNSLQLCRQLRVNGHQIRYLGRFRLSVEPILESTLTIFIC